MPFSSVWNFGGLRCRRELHSPCDEMVCPLELTSQWTTKTLPELAISPNHRFFNWIRDALAGMRRKHRRGPSAPRHSAVSRDQSVRRSAQDDDSVGVLTENILDKLALIGSKSCAVAGILVQTS